MCMCVCICFGFSVKTFHLKVLFTSVGTRPICILALVSVTLEKAMENGTLFQVYSTHVIFLLTYGGSGQQTGWLAMIYICCQDWHSAWSRSTSYSFTWAERHMLASWLLYRIWLLLTLLYEGFLLPKVSEMLCIQFVCLASYLFFLLLLLF